MSSARPLIANISTVPSKKKNPNGLGAIGEDGVGLAGRPKSKISYRRDDSTARRWLTAKSNLFRGQGREIVRGVAEPAETPVLSPDATEEGSSSSEIRTYRLSLARQARRLKNYPPQARENAWEGVVVIGISALAGGSSPVLVLSQSSGFEVLDAQAIEMLRSAASRSSIPENLRDKGFTTTLQIHFQLAE